MIRSLPILLISCFVVLQAETLIHTDFADPAAYRPFPANYPSHITGALPPTVKEDSSWAKITIRHQHQKNPLGGERGWLNTEIQGGERGQAQLKWILPSLDSQAEYRLSLQAATQDQSSITFAIRDNGPPWKAYWEKTISPSGYMGQQHVDFKLPALGDNKTLIAHMGQKGRFQIQELRLIRRDAAELAQERKEKLSNAPDNLLAVTGFPLGLPPLWSTGNRHSWEQDIIVESKQSASSRGTVPLRLGTRVPNIQAELFSAPFEPLIRSEKHTLSFYIRGKVQDASVEVRVNKKALVRKTLPSSPTEWQRVSLTFTPDPLAPFHVIRWAVKGDVEIDSLMLNLGDRAKAFQLQQDAEVILSADRSKNHVMVDGVDEKKLQAAVMSAPKGAQLELTAYNISGQAQPLPAKSLNGDSIELLEISTAELFPHAPFGPFRMEARVTLNGQEISPPSDLVYYHLRKPRFWGTITTDSAFGGHFHPHEPHLYSAKALGQNWNRLHGDNGKWSYWSGVEPQKGNWTFHPKRMQTFRDAGFALIGVWLHCPGWARIERQNNNGWPDNWWQPRDYAEYEEYVRQVTKAYAPYIQHWQIWNEPWGEFWFKEWRPELGSQHQWHAGPDPEGDYVRISELAYKAGKETNEDILVMGMHATIGDKGKSWMKKMLKRDAEQYGDALSFHAYAGGNLQGMLSEDPNQLAGRLEKYIMAPIAKKGGVATEQDIWLTEGNTLGARTHSGGGLYRHSFVLEPDPPRVHIEESQRLAVYHLICFSEGVDHIISYAQNAVGDHFFEKVGPWWGSLGINGGELNSSAAVYAAMTWHLEGADFKQRLKMGDIHSFVFERKGTAVAALISGLPQDQSWTPPADAGLSIRDHLGNDSKGPFDFGSLVWVEMEGSTDELIETLTHSLRAE